MKVAVFIICLFLVVLSFSQKSFKVVHVKGNLEKELEHKPIKLGDELTQQELLSVKEDKVNCLLFNGVDRMVLKPENRLTKGSVEELFAFVPKRQMMSSRGNEDSSYLRLSDFFKNDRYLFLDSIEKIRLDEDYIKDLGNNRFIIVDGDNKKALVQFEKSMLNFETKNIFKSNEFEKSIKIYSVNAATGVFVKETEVVVSRIRKEDFEKQSKLVVSLLDEGLTDSEKIKQSYTVLEEIYGGLNFQKWEQFYQAMEE